MIHKFVWLFSISWISIHGLHLPEYIKPCSIRSPDFGDCAIKHGNEAIPFLIKGDRAYGIPPFNPFKLPFVQINTGGLDMNLTNSVFTGAETLKVLSYVVNNQTKSVSIRLTAPLVILEFDCAVTGKIASIPIEGNGHGKMDFIDGIYGYDYKYTLKKKNGKTYLRVGDDKMLIQPKNMKTNLQNLFEGNQQLGDALNQFLNENWKELLTEFLPTVSSVFATIARTVLEKLLQDIPVEEIYTDW